LWYQKFRLTGVHILNEKGKALDVSEGQDAEGVNVIAKQMNSDLSQ